MLISIGILAWNEEDVIETTLNSLFQQSVFQHSASTPPHTEWEIIVVPNGCTDDTAVISQRVLSKLCSEANEKKINFTIQELTEPGKSNAWNQYIHEFSSKNAELILMIDADIEFKQTETISNTIKALNQNPTAAVAVDLPLKDAEKKESKTLIEWISTSSSSIATSGSPGIAGSFYCARADVLRQIWIPKGLPVEDGFLRSMILTNFFRSELDEKKIIRVSNASHYYGTLTSIKEIFNHEVRMVIGTAVNCYLTWDFLMYATDPNGPGAGVLIKNQVENNPSWFPSLVNNAIKNRGIWVLPRGMIFRRFAKFKLDQGVGIFKITLVAIIGFILDIPVLITANHKLKKDKAIGFW